MNKYLFLLGNHPDISIEEIKKLLQFLNIDATYRSLTREILLVNTSQIINAKEIIDKLGGTIKIAQVFETSDKVCAQKIIGLIKNEKKVRIGISSYTDEINAKAINYHLRQLKDLANDRNIKINYIIPKDKNCLSSAQVFHKILPSGYEIIIVKDGNVFILAKTLAVQNVDLLSKLDYGIPYSQQKAGMLPPKLAQMMINLSLDSQKEFVLYDPFCGTGRVLMQALYCGHNTVYASDVYKDAVEKTKKNIMWLAYTFKINIGEDFYINNIFVHNARQKLNKIDKKITSIVTEPDLGTAYKQNPKIEDVKSEFERLESLYIESFTSFKSILAKDAKLVVVFPKIADMSLLDELVDKLESLGYYMERNFIYARDYQIVKRHIGVFNFISNK